jgi:hypothetical protein
MLDLLRTFLTVARRQSIGRPARWMIYRRTEQCFGLVAWKPPSFMMIASKSKPISPNRLSFDGPADRASFLPRRSGGGGECRTPGSFGPIAHLRCRPLFHCGRSQTARHPELSFKLVSCAPSRSIGRTLVGMGMAKRRTGAFAPLLKWIRNRYVESKLEDRQPDAVKSTGRAQARSGAGVIGARLVRHGSRWAETHSDDRRATRPTQPRQPAAR